jgi:integrative and conjugative element protein (TIGR02256 family)
LITDSVLDFIEVESRRSPTTETGGVIAGTGKLGTYDVAVTHATGPGPRARRTKYSFARDVSYCQAQIDQFARESGGLVDYLGEWHKHHEEEPCPSPRDIGTLSNIARDKNYHVTLPLLFIIGESNDRESLRVFAVDRLGELTRVEWGVLHVYWSAQEGTDGTPGCG